MRKSKILVTGGAGYIGSHTVVELIKAGYEPVIIDNLSNSELFIIDQIKAITGIKPTFYPYNLTDKIGVEKVFETEKSIQAIIHFAAFKAVGESIKKPLAYFYNNLVSTLHVLQLMAQKGIPNFVFSSSCTVYGEPDTVPVTEQAPIKKALTAYGSSKQMAEEILEKSTGPVTGIQAISLRYFNPVGAHESALIGELPLGIPNNLMPYITQTAIGKRKCLTIFGADYATPDGTCIRDYIHVSDLAKAHVKACYRLLNNHNKTDLEVFNLGTGKGCSVLEVVKAFTATTAQPLNYQIGPRREGDATCIYADATYAKKELGWSSALTLNDMIRSAWQWELALKELKVES